MSFFGNATDVDGSDRDDLLPNLPGGGSNDEPRPAWQRDVWPGVATVAVVSGILIIIMVAVIIYKIVTACQNQKRDGSIGDIEKAAAAKEAAIHGRHRTISEDNPHNKWSTTDLHEAVEDEQQSEAALYKKRLLRTSISE